MRVDDTTVRQLQMLILSHPACNARCDDAKGEHATLMWLGQALGTGSPDDRELAATLSVQLTLKGATYLGHEPAPEAPPPDPAWRGNLYLVPEDAAGKPLVLGLGRNVPPEAVRSAEDGAYTAYLVRWFFPIPFEPIRRDYRREFPVDAAQLGLRERDA